MAKGDNKFCTKCGKERTGGEIFAGKMTEITLCHDCVINDAMEMLEKENEMEMLGDDYVTSISDVNGELSITKALVDIENAINNIANKLEHLSCSLEALAMKRK